MFVYLILLHDVFTLVTGNYVKVLLCRRDVVLYILTWPIVSVNQYSFIQQICWHGHNQSQHANKWMFYTISRIRLLSVGILK